MTAQQQLVELNSRRVNTSIEGTQYRVDCAEFIARHGRALAKLIDAVSEFREYNCRFTRVVVALESLTEPK